MGGLWLGKKAIRAMCVTFTCGGYPDYLNWQFKTRLVRLQSFFFLFFSASKHGPLATGESWTAVCHKLSLDRIGEGEEVHIVYFSGGYGAYSMIFLPASRAKT